MEAVLVAVINKISDPALLILLVICAGLGWLHVVWRREEREDRKTWRETVDKNTEVLNKLVNLLSAMTGKPI